MLLLTINLYSYLLSQKRYDSVFIITYYYEPVLNPLIFNPFPPVFLPLSAFDSVISLERGDIGGGEGVEGKFNNSVQYSSQYCSLLNIYIHTHMHACIEHRRSLLIVYSRIV